MAPEIREGKGSAKSDIYSLGKVFRELLTGDLNGDVRRLERVWGAEHRRMLKEIADTIDGMLSVNPVDRPSIGEILKIVASSRTWSMKMAKK
jgi:serine/threonine protein kinase